MIPPTCHVCGLDLRSAPDESSDMFVIVYFADSPTMPSGWAGHPHGAVWFCRDHAHLGQERESMDTAPAMAEIDALFPREKYWRVAPPTNPPAHNQ